MSLELSVLLTAECESYQQILKVLMAASCCTVRQKDAALIPQLKVKESRQYF